MRVLLGALLAARGDTVSSDALIELLWPRDRPGDPEGALHTQISRLRGIVGDDLETRPPGYRLVVDGERLDAARFESAAAAAAESDGDVAIEQYRAAEAEWRGQAFFGLDEIDRSEAVRLERLRTEVVLSRLSQMLERGQASAALPEIEGLATGQALEEKPHALLMRAFAATGRKADALRVFQKYASRLAEETGLEPSAELRELELSILLDKLDPPPEPPSRPLVGIPMTITYTERKPGESIAIGTAGSGPGLLMHPAWLSRLDMFGEGLDGRAPFVSRLTADFRVVMFDRHGTGLSRGTDVGVSFEASVEELVHVLDVAAEAPAMVLASSAAGPTAIAAASARADLFRGLVLLGTYASGPTIFPPRVAESMVGLVRSSWGMGSRLLGSLIFPSATAEMLDGFARFQRQAASRDMAVALLKQMYAADVSSLLGDLDVPTLVIHHRGDRAVPFAGGEELARSIPGAELMILEGAHHFPRAEDHERVVAAIRTLIHATRSSDVSGTRGGRQADG